MTNIEMNSKKSVLEVRNELSANGTKMEVVYVDGKRFCALGYVSRADREASIKAIETAVRASNGNLMEAAMKLMTIANLAEAAPDEEIEIDGITLFLSYENRALYDANGEEVCNCNDLDCCLPNEAIKALLMERVQNALREIYEEDYE